jgi:hypothetical protein
LLGSVSIADMLSLTAFPHLDTCFVNVLALVYGVSVYLTCILYIGVLTAFYAKRDISDCGVQFFGTDAAFIGAVHDPSVLLKAVLEEL